MTGLYQLLFTWGRSCSALNTKIRLKRLGNYCHYSCLLIVCFSGCVSPLEVVSSGRYASICFDWVVGCWSLGCAVFLCEFTEA